MATDKKHIAVYLAPEVEQALVAFCEQNGLISKKGTMFSAGVNAALAQFFGITGTETSNILSTVSTIPSKVGNLPSNSESTIPSVGDNIRGNIPSESLAVEVLPGKLRA